MVKKCFKVLIGLVCILFCYQIILSQDLDTNRIISKIRKQYSMIINKEVEGVELETVAVGSIPESPMFKWIEVDEEYLFSYSQNDTFLIRHYSAADEGGTFWIEVKEVCL